MTHEYYECAIQFSIKPGDANWELKGWYVLVLLLADLCLKLPISVDPLQNNIELKYLS